MQTLKGLIEEKNVTAEANYSDRYNEEFPNSTSWDVTLHYQRRQMTVPFYTGSAITENPTAYDVLYCLISDADVENYDFEEWAENLGYDTDSRKAEKTYNQCVAQTKKLHKFLGDDYELFTSVDPDQHVTPTIKPGSTESDSVLPNTSKGD